MYFNFDSYNRVKNNLTNLQPVLTSHKPKTLNDIIKLADFSPSLKASMS